MHQKMYATMLTTAESWGNSQVCSSVMAYSPNNILYSESEEQYVTTWWLVHGTTWMHLRNSVNAWRKQGGRWHTKHFITSNASKTEQYIVQKYLNIQKILDFVISKEMINSTWGVISLEGVRGKREHTGKCSDRGNLLVLKLGGQFSQVLQGHIFFHI